jgi:hypothetical protein
MGEHTEQRITNRRRIARKHPVRQTPELIALRLPDYSAACSHAASKGWLIVSDDALTLTTAGLAAA